MDAEVVFWVEYHRRTEQDTVTQTHELGRWIGQQRLDNVLLVLPGEPNGQKYCCSMGGPGARGEAPVTEPTDSGNWFPRAPERIELRPNNAAILAVKIHGSRDSTLIFRARLVL